MCKVETNKKGDLYPYKANNELDSKQFCFTRGFQFKVQLFF